LLGLTGVVGLTTGVVGLTTGVVGLTTGVVGLTTGVVGLTTGVVGLTTGVVGPLVGTTAPTTCTDAVFESAERPPPLPLALLRITVPSAVPLRTLTIILIVAGTEGEILTVQLTFCPETLQPPAVAVAPSTLSWLGTESVTVTSISPPLRTLTAME
jgi:hypothetical protein